MLFIIALTTFQEVILKLLDEEGMVAAFSQLNLQIIEIGIVSIGRGQPLD
jgi:hypothetical protein